MKKNMALRVGGGVAISTIFTWLVVRNVNLGDVKEAARSVDLGWLGLALLGYVAGYVCRIERWRRMLIHENPGIRWRDCAGPFFAGYAANNILPFRAGDIVRAVAFSNVLGARPGAVVTTLVVERLLDLLALLLALSGSILVFGIGRFHLSTVGVLILVMSLVLVLIVLFFPWTVVSVARWACAGIRRLAPKFAERLVAEVEKGAAMLTVLTAAKNLVGLLFLTIVVWTIEGWIFFSSALSVPALAVPEASLVALSMGTLSTLIPSAPGFIGTFEYFVVISMTEMGNPTAAASVYALIVHGVLAFPSLLLGGIYLLFSATRFNTGSLRT